MSTMDKTPVVTSLDPERAQHYFPRPGPKQAVLVRIPQGITPNGEVDLPTYIATEWGGVQVFYGDYYAIIKNGVVAYGSARDQWLNMHVQFHPNRPELWVKVGVPRAQRVLQSCRVITSIADDDRVVGEVNAVTLKPGDWIVQQPGGELQHIKASNFFRIYFTPEEAMQLGLTSMSSDDFTHWAISQALASV